MSAPLLEAKALTLKVAGRMLVRGLSFAIAAGEVWCFLGPNGAGKTTLLHTLAGLREPDHGAVNMQGRPLAAWSPRAAAQTRAFLPQTLYDAFSATVLETVMLGRHPYLAPWHWENEHDRGRAAAALSAVDLTGLEARDVLTLSGGERQRVAVATILAQDAPLLLLDEPVSHLDLRHQITVLDHLRSLSRAGNVGVLFTVHDLNLAARYATHVLIITPDGVEGGPAAHVLNEEILQQAFGQRVLRIETAGRTLFVPE